MYIILVDTNKVNLKYSCFLCDMYISKSKFCPISFKIFSTKSDRPVKDLWAKGHTGNFKQTGNVKKTSRHQLRHLAATGRKLHVYIPGTYEANPSVYIKMCNGLLG